jgi:adenylosuccinate synthase
MCELLYTKKGKVMIMPITIVVGGQFGGEGKGKVVAHLCRNRGFDIAVRCGGPNSGHTITLDGRQVVLRQVPAGVVNPSVKLFLAAGCLIDQDVLFKEIELFNLHHDRLKIDRNAVIITNDYAQKEKEAQLDSEIGSTCTGTGFAVAERVLRRKGVKLAKDVPSLAPYLAEVSKEIMSCYINENRIVVEGTQGFGLSVYHSPYYPYATSRDTTASGFLSEVGASPLAVSDIIMVLRTFPIRVGGNSGPLPKEITWKVIQRESGCPYEPKEFTSVTKKLRRVARFDVEIVKMAAVANMPTQIALMGVDYLDYANRGAVAFSQLTEKTKEFVFWVERQIGAPITLIGTGPTDSELIDMLEKCEYEQERERKGITKTVPMS